MKEIIDEIVLNVVGNILGRPEYGFARQRPTTEREGEVSTSLDFEKAGGSSTGIIFRYDLNTREYYIGYYHLEKDGLERKWVEFKTKEEKEAVEEFQKAVSQIPRYRLRDIAKKVRDARGLEEAISVAFSDLAERKKEEYKRWGYPEETTECEARVLRDYVTETFQNK